MTGAANNVVLKVRAGVQQTLAETRTSTPEMRLLREHFVKTGVDDARRAARLDPSQHLYGCRCAQCDTSDKPCPVQDCPKVLKGTIKLAAHLERHRLEAISAKRVERSFRRARMEPAGLGFIDRLLGDPARGAALDLRGLRAFEEKLLASTGATGGRQRAKFVAKAKLDLEVALGAPEGTCEYGVRVPNTTAVVIQRFAILAGVHPRTVIAALVAWGIEKFVADVRASGLVTEPHVERGLSNPPATTSSHSVPFSSGDVNDEI